MLEIGFGFVELTLVPNRRAVTVLESTGFPPRSSHVKRSGPTGTVSDSLGSCRKCGTAFNGAWRSQKKIGTACNALTPDNLSNGRKETMMAKNKRDKHVTGELVRFQPATEVTVIAPSSCVVGKFPEETQNMSTGDGAPV
jgi:hypothetical protein